jgi:hypothetical protein
MKIFNGRFFTIPTLLQFQADCQVNVRKEIDKTGPQR